MSTKGHSRTVFHHRPSLAEMMSEKANESIADRLVESARRKRRARLSVADQFCKAFVFKALRLRCWRKEIREIAQIPRLSACEKCFGLRLTHCDRSFRCARFDRSISLRLDRERSLCRDEQLERALDRSKFHDRSATGNARDRVIVDACGGRDQHGAGAATQRLMHALFDVRDGA